MSCCLGPAQTGKVDLDKLLPFIYINSIMALTKRPLLILSILSVCVGSFELTQHYQADAKTKVSIKKVRTAPQGFIGANFNPWEIADGGGDVVQELERASASGIESIRFPLYWMRVQKYNIPMSQVGKDGAAYYTPDPQGGPAYRWAELDQLMLAAARLNISVLPTIMGAPAWAADPAYADPSNPKFINIQVPLDYSRFARFAAAVAQRYSTSSSFWTDHQIAPVKIVGWQIWNEPDHPNFWPAHIGEKNGPRGAKLGWAPSYVNLFNTTRSAIKAADSSARVMMSSLLSVPQTSMATYYAAGGQNSFDQSATNMFTTPDNTIKRIGVFRTFLNSKRAKPPIYLTEFSYLSGKGMWPPRVSMMFDTITDTPINAGRRAAAALNYFVANRTKYNLAAVYWYCWAGDDDLTGGGAWSFAGLRKFTPSGVIDKPGLPYFAQAALALEGR